MIDVLLIAGALATQPLPDPLQIEDAAIETAIEKGRHTQAHDMIELAGRDRRSRNTATLFRLTGILALAEGRDGDAFLAFAQAAKLASHDCRIDEGQGIAALRLGYVRAAQRSLERATAACPDRWRSWNALGVVHDRAGDWAASNAAYDRAGALAPDTPQIGNNRGYSLILQRRFDDAAAVLDTTVKHAPGDMRARRNLDIARVSGGTPPTPRSPDETDEAWSARLNNAGYVAHLAGRDDDAARYYTDAIAVRRTVFARAQNNADAVSGPDRP